MSAQSDYNTLELRQMDREQARRELTVVEFERWEALHENIEEAQATREEWDTQAETVHDVTVRFDVTDLASDVTLYGNPVSVYYDPEDSDFRAAAENVGEVFGVDLETIDGEDDVALTDEDVTDEQLDAAKDALAELVCAAIITWDGHHWDDLSPDTRAVIFDAVRDWGIAALMDAWVEIQVTVEDSRSERLDRINRFRSEKRRGDR